MLQSKSYIKLMYRLTTQCMNKLHDACENFSIVFNLCTYTCLIGNQQVLLCKRKIFAYILKCVHIMTI